MVDYCSCWWFSGGEASTEKVSAISDFPEIGGKARQKSLEESHGKRSKGERFMRRPLVSRTFEAKTTAGDTLQAFLFGNEERDHVDGGAECCREEEDDHG